MANLVYTYLTRGIEGTRSQEPSLICVLLTYIGRHFICILHPKAARIEGIWVNTVEPRCILQICCKADLQHTQVDYITMVFFHEHEIEIKLYDIISSTLKPYNVSLRRLLQKKKNGRNGSKDEDYSDGDDSDDDDDRDDDGDNK